MTAVSLRPFWQPYWSARRVVAVEVNGYTIEPGADLYGADLRGAEPLRSEFALHTN